MKHEKDPAPRVSRLTLRDAVFTVVLALLAVGFFATISRVLQVSVDDETRQMTERP